MLSTAARSATSQRVERASGSSLARAASADSSMSQTKTFAPVAANARAISRPMPAAPAVINTCCDMSGSCRLRRQQGSIVSRMKRGDIRGKLHHKEFGFRNSPY
jgi:hypothetical protein